MVSGSAESRTGEALKPGTPNLYSLLNHCTRGMGRVSPSARMPAKPNWKAASGRVWKRMPGMMARMALRWLV